MWTNVQIEEWYWSDRLYLADTVAVRTDENIRQRRLRVRQDLLQLLNAFLAKDITLRDFDRIFQQKTRKVWDVFYLGKVLGRAFVEKLIRYIPGEDALTNLLRLMLRIPRDQQDGQRRMQEFARFLEGIIISQECAKRQFQPMYIPFFLSVWWHLQEIESWPIFYPELCHILLVENPVTAPLQDPVEAYFIFRARFLALKQELYLDSSELEQLIVWHFTHSSSSGGRGVFSASQGSLLSSQQLTVARNDNHSNIVSTCSNIISGRRDLACKKGQENTDCADVQWLLANLGEQ